MRFRKVKFDWYLHFTLMYILPTHIFHQHSPQKLENLDFESRKSGLFGFRVSALNAI